MSSHESEKKEKWIDLGKHRIQNNVLHSFEQFRRGRGYPNLALAVMYLAKTAVLSLPEVEIVTLKDVEKGGEGSGLE